MKKPSGEVHAVIGMQWGDEGKGKEVDYLASQREIDGKPFYVVVARPAGGPNAGHTVVVNGEAYDFHGLPEGAIHEGVLSVIGPGAFVDPIKLTVEIERFNVPDDRLAISNNTHLITPAHISRDEIREAQASKKQGSTKVGMAYAAAQKYQREGIPLCYINGNTDEVYESLVAELDELNKQRQALGLTLHNPGFEASAWLEAAQSLKKYEVDTTILLNQVLEDGGNILASGAQSHWLDIDEQPYAIGGSTHTGIDGVVGLKIPPQSITKVLGIVKAYKTRVGDGPIVTRIEDEELAGRLMEYGVTTGRPRLPAYLDLPEIRRSIMANGVTELALNKLDQLEVFSELGSNIKISTAYNIPGQPKPVRIAPNVKAELEKAEPQYEVEFEPFSMEHAQAIKAARSFGDLPEPVKKFVRFIENELEIDIKLIGNGPDRRDIIARY